MNPVKINVFIIDQNVMMRRILSNILLNESGVSIPCSIGNASFEDLAAKLEAYQPALLFLGVDDLDSDEMNLFYQLRDARPELHIVLMTHLNTKGAAVALNGLKHGAVDYITKPENRFGLLFADRHFHKRVIPILKAVPDMCRKYSAGISDKRADRVVSKEFFPNVGQMNPDNIDIIIFGGCLGGVSSLYKIIPSLPGWLQVPVVVVQHMPKVYTRELSSDLDKESNLNVKEATDKCSLVPGTVYIAPGGYHSVVKNDSGRKQLVLHKGPKEHKCRPSIDVLLRSIVQEYGGNILGILLSGMGNDGVLGALTVLEHGGIIRLESQESALVSELSKKVKLLNSEIKEVDASRMSLDIVNLMNQFTLQKITDSHSNRFTITKEYGPANNKP
ncbi:MAG TPA: chemotaxis protein CheB [Balneolaceae bacterium]|nr:chemotaxis protein CheB [Balneolaceae bacterium]